MNCCIPITNPKTLESEKLAHIYIDTEAGYVYESVADKYKKKYASKIVKVEDISDKILFIEFEDKKDVDFDYRMSWRLSNILEAYAWSLRYQDYEKAGRCLDEIWKLYRDYTKTNYYDMIYAKIRTNGCSGGVFFGNFGVVMGDIKKIGKALANETRIRVKGLGPDSKELIDFRPN